MTGQPFHTTRWSLVARAGEWKADAADPSEARAALEELVRAYWPPLYAFARVRGSTREDAEDLVQGFFARAVEKGGLVPRERRARFRAFLLAAFQHFAANEHERAQARKRGGDRARISLDDLHGELHDELHAGSTHEDSRLASPDDTPERAYERRYAQRVLERLRTEQERAGKGAGFARLAPLLTGDDVAAPYAELARELGSTPGALKVAVHRLRRRYGELLLGSLRANDTHSLLEAAFVATSRESFRIVEHSIQSNHLHMVVEAQDERALARGMIGLSVRIVRGLNKLWKRSGSVFEDRYHARILTSPSAERNALVYVLNNAR